MQVTYLCHHLSLSSTLDIAHLFDNTLQKLGVSFLSYSCLCCPWSLGALCCSRLAPCATLHVSMLLPAPSCGPLTLPGLSQLGLGTCKPHHCVKVQSEGEWDYCTVKSSFNNYYLKFTHQVSRISVNLKEKTQIQKINCCCREVVRPEHSRLDGGRQQWKRSGAGGVPQSVPPGSQRRL